MPLHPLSRPKKETGLRYWMLAALQECDRVSVDFAADPVHDLRVALRRCRSLADGLMAIDPDPKWKAMKKAGKLLFQRLGALRDIQVMMEWTEKLEAMRLQSASEQANVSVGLDFKTTAAPDGSHDSSAVAAASFLRILRQREKEQQREAQSALEEFDRKQWKEWARALPASSVGLRPGNPLFKHLALERWTAARALHSTALRNRSQVAFHALRIGIKRFRYIVENFLPAEHESWSGGLKKLQDILGEVHDLDVLWATAIECKVFTEENSRKLWREIIAQQRLKRIDLYRQKTFGPDSLWLVWRAGLPRGEEIETLATRRMKLWASRLDPDFPHSEHVAGLALQIYDGLLAWGWEPAVDAVSARSSLLAAALLHDVGKSKGEKGHHRVSLDLIRAYGNPLGWQPADMQRAAVVARFHCGSLPNRRKKSLRDLLPTEQKAVIQLSAILRLANALDVSHDGRVTRLRIENGQNDELRRKSQGNAAQTRTGIQPTHSPGAAVVISAEGYSATGADAHIIAAERHLLETVLRRPVLVKATKTSAARLRKASVRPAL